MPIMLLLRRLLLMGDWSGGYSTDDVRTRVRNAPLPFPLKPLPPTRCHNGGRCTQHGQQLHLLKLPLSLTLNIDEANAETILALFCS